MALKPNHDGGLVVKRMGCIISLLVLILISVGGCQSKSAALVQGEKTPLFQLKRLDGELLQFPDMFAGKVVVIRFWADWCPFCKSEMKSIEPIYEKYRSKGLVILALNVRQDRKTAAAFINKLGISYDVLLDEEGETARNYGVIGLPTTFFIDQKGLLHTRIIGESSAALFEQIVGELL